LSEPGSIRIAALILAAGESRRMGFPKPLLDFRGETFLDHLIASFAPFCEPVIAVLGAHAERVRAGMKAAAKALLVENPDYRLGQLTSMQCGLRAVPSECAGLLFTLVDHPNVAASTIEALLAERGARLVIPRFEGRRGHPIYIPRDLIPEFLALGPEQSAKEVIHKHAPETRYLDLTDPGILDDVDDPETYRRLAGTS
jgi:molybdenum cofactor cytidylyltransferase